MLSGLCKLGCASNSANPFSAASPVLGGVTMGETAERLAPQQGAGDFIRKCWRGFSQLASPQPLQ
jgi:hypothetical protein